MLVVRLDSQESWYQEVRFLRAYMVVFTDEDNVRMDGPLMSLASGAASTGIVMSYADLHRVPA